MADQETNWITLVDEEGHEHRFNLLNIVEVDKAKYAVMIPEIQESEEEQEEAVIFRIETDDEGEEVLVDIEDDDEFAKVCEVLDEMDLDEAEEDDHDHGEQDKS
jgi:putative holliday junction resolvase